MQIYGDPEAADIVFTCGADILVVGINITHQVYWTGILKAAQSSYFFFWIRNFIIASICYEKGAVDQFV